MMKSLSRTSTGETQMNIPIEVQLSDKLIHKLLRQTQGQQLDTIHKIARQRANAAVTAATSTKVSLLKILFQSM